MVAFFGARLLMRMHGVSPTVSTTLSNSRPRPLVCRSPFVMSSPHDVRALSRPRSQQRTLYPTVRRDAPRRARQGIRIPELHANSPRVLTLKCEKQFVSGGGCHACKE